MRELWPVVRSNLRRRRMSTLVLAVLVGLSLGVTASAAIGARRTATAFPRFVAAQGAADLYVSAFADGAQLADAIRHQPQVARAGVGTGVGVLLRNPDGSPDFERDAFGALVSDGVLGYDVDHPLLLAGRLPDPDAPFELVLDENAVRTTGAGVGDVIPALTFDVEEIQAASAELEGSGREPTQADYDRVLTPVDLEVVGIGRTSNGVLANEAVVGEPTALLSPAFIDEHPDSASYTVAAVDVVDASSAGDYVGAVRAALPDLEIELLDQADLRDGFAAAVRPYWLALAFFAAVFGTGALLSLGPAVVRTVDDELADRSTLQALGATRRQLLGIAVVRVAAVLGGGAALGAGLSVVLSSRFPIGPARAAEPDLGTEVHLVGLVAGAALVCVVAAVAAGLRGVALTRRGSRRIRRPSASVTRAGALGLSPAALTGVHAAFGDRRDRSRRGAATIGVGLALAIAIGALGFGSGLSRLVDDPARFGWSWDVLFEHYDTPLDDEVAQALRDDPGIDGVVPIARGSVTLDGRPVPAVGLELGSEGDIAPVVLEGRAPAAPGEIVLGAITARRLGVGVGDSVGGDVGRAEPLDLEVVGLSVVPSLALDSSNQLGHGALVLREDYEQMAGWSPTAAIATLAVGATFREVESRHPDGISPLGVQRPAEVLAYDGIDEVPGLLAGILGLLAVAVLVHLLIGSVRRRSRELAVLRTLGLRPRQVASSILWQSGLLATSVVVLAVPLGLAAGRAAWRWFADGIGIATDPSSPLALVAAGTVLVLVVANIVALGPARRAAGVHPAQTLRTE